jgi:hypothetical protein
MRAIKKAQDSGYLAHRNLKLRLRNNQQAQFKIAMR